VALDFVLPIFSPSSEPLWSIRRGHSVLLLAACGLGSGVAYSLLSRGFGTKRQPLGCQMAPPEQPFGRNESFRQDSGAGDRT
jgi:hypothetical protein